MRTALELSTPVWGARGVFSPVGELKMLVTFSYVPGLLVPSACAVLGLALVSSPARADGAVAPKNSQNETVSAPPQSEHAYLQYGVALSAEIVASPGPACSDANTPCILGSGGGVVARGGWRRNERWYFGAAYEMSKLDPHELYRLAILQQVRVEVRRYFPTGRAASPFVLLAAGVGGYGNEWFPIDTWGPNAGLGGGVEVLLGGSAFVVSLAYHPMYFHEWNDSSLLHHDAGIAHFVGLEAAVEARDTL